MAAACLGEAVWEVEEAEVVVLAAVVDAAVAGVVVVLAAVVVDAAVAGVAEVDVINIYALSCNYICTHAQEVSLAFGQKPLSFAETPFAFVQQSFAFACVLPRRWKKFYTCYKKQ